MGSKLAAGQIIPEFSHQEPKSGDGLLAGSSDPGPATLAAAEAAAHQLTPGQAIHGSHQGPGVAVSHVQRTGRRGDGVVFPDPLQENYPAPAQVGLPLPFQPEAAFDLETVRSGDFLPGPCPGRDGFACFPWRYFLKV